MSREKLLWKKKWTQFMKASSFTKSSYTFVPLQARIWCACTAICVIYIFSGENITAKYTMSRRRWDQNTTQVANRLDWARAIYVWLLHLTPWADRVGRGVRIKTTTKKNGTLPRYSLYVLARKRKRCIFSSFICFSFESCTTTFTSPSSCNSSMIETLLLADMWRKLDL